MYWPKLAILAFFGLCFGRFAAADPGFLPAGAPQIPQAIRASAAKVLQLWTPIGFSTQPQSKYAAILRALDKVTPDNVRTDLTYQMMREEVRRCQARALPNCRVTNQVMQGSAFVLPDGTLIAARHDFSQTGQGLALKFLGLAEDWAADSKVTTEKSRVEADIEAFKRDPMRDTIFIITDAQGRVVFNSGKQEFRFLRYGALTKLRGQVDLRSGMVNLDGQDPSVESEEFTGVDWINQDSVRIQLPVRLPALPLANAQTCKPGSRISIVGYPGHTTTTRAALGARDGVWNELSVSQGQILTLEQLALRAAHWRSFNRYSEQVRGRTLLVTDADGTSGVSGGPILNEQGEVCGMFKAFYPGDEKPVFDAQTQTLEMFSLGISLEDLTGI